jgi:hypothetical protein
LIQHVGRRRHRRRGHHHDPQPASSESEKITEFRSSLFRNLNIQRGYAAREITSTRERSVKKSLIVGYIVLPLGMAIWLYGYFAPGNPSLIDWRAHSPWWIADFLPNIESEIGMVLMLISAVPSYWPRSRISRAGRR